MENPEVFYGILLLASLGYWVASGAIRANYRLLHVVLGLALFFISGFLLYYLIQIYFDNSLIGKIIGGVVSVILVIVIAYRWRKSWAESVFQFLRNFGITTTSFGPDRAWDNFSSIPGREFHYYLIELKNGDRIGSDQYKLSVKEIQKELDFDPDTITDEQGNIIIVATELWKKGKKKSKKSPIKNKKGCTKFTYIPASSIRKIEIFIKPKPKRKCC